MRSSPPPKTARTTRCRVNKQQLQPDAFSGMPESMAEDAPHPPIPPFDPQGHLQEGWRVNEYAFGRCIVLSQDTSETLRQMKRQAGAVAISLFMMALLFFGGRFSSDGFEKILWPVEVLFGLIALLGLLSLQRSYRALRQGVGLRLDAQANAVEGHPQVRLNLFESWKDFRFQKLRRALSEVDRILVRVLPGTGPHDVARAELLLAFHKETQCWVGPTAWALENDDVAARDALLPLAVEMGRVADCAVEVEYPDEAVAPLS